MPINNGAKTIVSDLNFQGKKENILFINSKNVRKLVSEILQNFFKKNLYNLLL